MRILRESIERSGEGSVALFPEDPEDMVGPAAGGARRD